MNRHEAKFMTLFRHWIKVHANEFPTSVFELKSTTSFLMPFSHIEQHQIDYALAIRSDRGVFIRNQGGGGEPDFSFYKNTPAYIVIRYPGWFVGIIIEDFIKEKQKSKTKSLSRSRALEICSFKQGI